MIIIDYLVIPSLRFIKIDHEYLKLRELQRSLPIRFNSEYRRNPPSFNDFVKNELNISLLNNGLPSSFKRAKAKMLLYQKYRDEDELMIPRQK
ncbi:hypothetical protein F8M41_003532 [Gigaspora margarita]|uniref:Uncharacterized protein n=1 Tax=Gigaspora margarita TaxID=4874 RepID=A0A8H4A7E4_GIGMA|nr:hypothetical protein F8M41_003532 [Gigaspora margarita]